MASIIGHVIILVGVTNFVGMIPGFVAMLALPGPLKIVGGALSDGVFTLLAGLGLLHLFGVQPGVLLPALSCPFPLIYYLSGRYQQPPAKLIAYMIGLWGTWALV